MRLMLSEAVLMSTLQSRSTRRGRETVNKTAQLRAPVPLKLMSLHCVKAVLSVARSPAFHPQEWGARSQLAPWPPIGSVNLWRRLQPKHLPKGYQGGMRRMQRRR